MSERAIGQEYMVVDFSYSQNTEFFFLAGTFSFGQVPKKWTNCKNQPFLTHRCRDVIQVPSLEV